MTLLNCLFIDIYQLETLILVFFWFFLAVSMAAPQHFRLIMHI